MKHILIALCLIAGMVSESAAQVSQRYAARIYRSGDQLIISDSLGNSQNVYPFSSAQIVATNSLVRVNISGLSKYYTPAKVLNKTGGYYSTTSTAAVVAGIIATAPTGTVPNSASEIGGAMQSDFDAYKVTVQNAFNATEPGVLKFTTYAQAISALTGRTKPARVLIMNDTVNNSGGFGKYDWNGVSLIEDIL